MFVYSTLEGTEVDLTSLNVKCECCGLDLNEYNKIISIKFPNYGENVPINEATIYQR